MDALGPGHAPPGHSEREPLCGDDALFFDASSQEPHEEGPHGLGGAPGEGACGGGGMNPEQVEHLYAVHVTNASEHTLVEKRGADRRPGARDVIEEGLR